MSTAGRWQALHSTGLLVAVVGVTLLGLFVAPAYRLWGWFGTLSLLFLSFLIVGHGITGLWRGLLIDEQNRISLSRLQMASWTLVVLSGLLMAALSNIAAKQPEPLSIAIPAELWLLMGISTTSLLASPLIKSNKRMKKASRADRDVTYRLLEGQGVNIKDVASVGQLVVNLRPEDSRWADLFRGEEVGNAAQVDLGKIQMLYFTVILIAAYAAALGSALLRTAAIREFPALDTSMLALLGISHAGYLVNKTVSHTEQEQR